MEYPSPILRPGEQAFKDARRRERIERAIPAVPKSLRDQIAEMKPGLRGHDGVDRGQINTLQLVQIAQQTPKLDEETPG